jgi:hypothetical protein
MKYLHLVFSLPGNLAQAHQTAAQAAPSLMKLLRLGETAAHEASLAGTLCQAFGIKQQQDWPLAPLCAKEDGMNAANGYWLRLDPVHLEVVMGGLLLRPPEVLQLSMPEARALISAINLHWAHAGLAVEAASPTRWYLRPPDTPNLRTTPLDQMHGEYLTPHLPRGADARHYLMLINEVQMLMHTHPVNLARESEGRPVVNGLWLWGGGNLPTCDTALDLAAGDGFELRALARHAGCAYAARPASLADISPSERALVALTAPDSAYDGDLETHLARLEQHWFRPLLWQLAWGRIRRARLDLLGQRAVNLTPGRIWQIWR